MEATRLWYPGIFCCMPSLEGHLVRRVVPYEEAVVQGEAAQFARDAGSGHGVAGPFVEVAGEKHLSDGPIQASDATVTSRGKSCGTVEKVAKVVGGRYRLREVEVADSRPARSEWELGDWPLG